MRGDEGQPGRLRSDAGPCSRVIRGDFEVGNQRGGAQERWLRNPLCFRAPLGGGKMRNELLGQCGATWSTVIALLWTF